MNGSNGSTRIFGWLTLAGAVAVVVGALGPWATVSALFAQMTVKGMDTDDGKRVIGVGLVALLCAALALARPVGDGAGSTGTVFAGLALVFLGYAGMKDMDNLSDLLNERGTGVLAQIGWGLYLVVVGGFGGAAAVIDFIAHVRAAPQRPDDGY